MTRPDGTLVVVTTNSAGTRSIVSAVDSQGNVTPIGSVVGQPLQPLTVAANGAVFAQTYVPNIFTSTRACASRSDLRPPTPCRRSTPAS